ncbi:MAG: sensor histidine kinase [Blautia wexlerae]
MLENLRKKMFRLFSWISLKYRLFITYLLLSSLILLLTSVFFYSASKKVLIKCATLSSQQQLSLITNNLGDKINHISDYAITLSINSNIANVLKENPTVPKNEPEHFLVNSELTNQTQRIIGLHKNIYAWDILDTENHWFHSSTTETDQLDSLLDSEILDNLRTNLAFQFLGPFQISGEPTFVVLKSITNIDNTKYLGALVLLIKEANISSVFRNLPDSSSRYFYITNEKRQILSSSSSKGIYEDFSSYAGIDPTKYKTLAETGSQIFSINNTDFLFICKSSPALNWKVINLIPLENLTLDHVVILHNILIISIVVFILSVVFSILCTSTVTAPIQRLVDKMKSASAGKLDISVSYSSNDELVVLYNQFNLMMQKIQTLLNDIYEEQNAKQKMEVQLLQSQINPHFLYNTLNTIKSLIELDMKETAVKAVSAMSTFYRNSLSKGQFIIPLRQELILTEQYLYIQNLRYMDFVDYEITYESSWEDHGAEIPKLTIQPVVENIFVHGLTNQMCHIHLNVSIKNNTIYISISDNGSGIPREKLTELNRSIRDFKTARYSFGLPSINHRISLLYGENYGLTIKSSPENGTTVTIAIPDKKSTLGGNIK